MYCRYCHKETNSDSSFCSDKCRKAYWAKADKKKINIKFMQKRLKEIASTLSPVKQAPEKKPKEENWQSTLFMYK